MTQIQEGVNVRLENLAEYVAGVNPRGVNKLAYKYGFIPASSHEGRKGMLFTGLMEEGEEFFKDIARIHPDRDLILNADGSPTEPNVIDLRMRKEDLPQTIGNSISKRGPSDIIAVIIIIIIAALAYHLYDN